MTRFHMTTAELTRVEAYAESLGIEQVFVSAEHGYVWDFLGEQSDDIVHLLDIYGYWPIPDDWEPAK